MTMRRWRSFVLALAAAAVLVPCASRADDGASIEAGRSAGRTLLIFRDPKVCGIAVLRDRCKADVDRYFGTMTDADLASTPKIGPHPLTGLRAFITDGDRDGVDRALVYINSRSATPQMWDGDARAAALFDAGVEDVLLPAAGGNLVMELLGSGSFVDLMANAARIPPGVLGVAVPRGLARGTGSSREMTESAHALVSALDAAQPPAADAVVPTGTGPAGLAALGVAGSTVVELVDSPAWLFQPGAQRLVDAYLARLRAAFPGGAEQSGAFRAATLPGAQFSHDAAIRQYNALQAAALQGEKERVRAYASGALAAQMVYNAAVLRDRATAGMLVAFTAQAGPLDAAIPGWTAARAGAATIGATDWAAQYRLGVQLVDLIEKANP